jgi:5-methyltetrahydrofolate--homocysteine methyltransferase
MAFDVPGSTACLEERMPAQGVMLQSIINGILSGEPEEAVEACQKALDAGLDAQTILNNGLMKGANEVGRLFECGEFFLPELMLAGRALKASMDIIRPLLEAQIAGGGASQGKVVIATVKTDIHDIGKNIVASMLTAAGFDVINMGVDVPIPEIINKAEETQADIIGLSALLTTSLPYMRDLIEGLKARNLRDKYSVLVGGASVTRDFAIAIGADDIGGNAAQAVEAAKQQMQRKAERRAG